MSLIEQNKLSLGRWWHCLGLTFYELMSWYKTKRDTCVKYSNTSLWRTDDLADEFEDVDVGETEDGDDEQDDWDTDDEMEQEKEQDDSELTFSKHTGTS